MSENLEPLSVRDAAELVTGQRWKDNETGKDTPSEDFLTGRAATEASQGFKPMWMADPVNKEADEPIQALRRDEVAEPIPVQYMEMGGPKAGQKMPDDQTVSAEQAAHDVSRFRDSVTETEQAQLNAEIARAMNEVLGEQQQQVPEAPEVPQPEVNQTGGDDEVAKMLQNPKLLAAVQQEVGRYQQHYQQVVAANAAAAAASLVASFPELQNVRADQIPAAIAVVNNQEPKRADQMLRHIEQVSGEVARDTVQRILLGRSGAIGTGTIPKDAILDIVTARGIADLVGTIKVQHVSGGVSLIGLKSYLAGREAFQGETLDWAWADEEPPADVFTELLTRLNVGNGPLWLTQTPLLGVSEVVRRFLHEKSPDRHVTFMTISDVTHFSEEEKQRIIASYPKHELEARTKGIPILGSGRIFPIEEVKIACEHRDFPSHWPRIGGMDFGWDHPFAAVELVCDRDTDTVYVARCHRLKEATPIEHAAAIRAWGNDLNWAWPRDGKRETLEGAGIALAEQYRDQGLKMLPEHAQFEDGSVSVEAGLMMMLDRMRTGKLKVFKEHLDWWEEFRLYHRKDGKVVKEGDDLMCATRYGLTHLRYAKTKSFSDKWRREIEYPRLGIV